MPLADAMLEKDGFCTSKIETEHEHEKDSISIHSRARRRSSDTWPRSSQGPYDNSQQPDRMSDHSVCSRDREHAPSISSQHFRSSVDSRERSRISLDSNRSRRRSRESTSVFPEGGFTGTNDQTPQSKHRHSSMHLNREDPGDWAIRHHLPNLITRLNKHDENPIGLKLDGLGAKVRDIQHGWKADSNALPLSAPASIPPPPGDRMRFRISFAEVQRMRIRKLQCQLVRHVVKMRLDGHEPPGWEHTLEQYIKALHDYDYMENRSESIRDPFLATGEYGVDNYILNCNIDSVLAKDISNRVDSLKPWDSESDQSNEPITGTRGRNVEKTWYRGFRERLVIAAAGGAFLVGPMWIMVLHGGLYTSLISTTAFVTAFGILMAYFLNEAKDVLASTAAYAAVLVVFVGTSNP